MSLGLYYKVLEQSIRRANLSTIGLRYFFHDIVGLIFERFESFAERISLAKLSGFWMKNTGSREVSYFFRPSTEYSTSTNLYRKLNFPGRRFTSIEGQDQRKPLPYNPNQPVAAQVQESFAKSLANLGTENVDALLLHSPLRTLEKTLEAWMELIKLRESGRVSLIGLSNVYDIETLQYVWEKTGVKPDIVQNRWYQGNNWDKAVVAFCKKESIHYEYVKQLLC